MVFMPNCLHYTEWEREKDPVQVMSFVDDWHKLYEVQTTQRQQHSSDDTKSVVQSAIQQQYEWHQYTTLWILEHNSNKQNLCQPMRMTSYPHLLWNNHIKSHQCTSHTTGPGFICDVNRRDTVLYRKMTRDTASNQNRTRNCTRDTTRITHHIH